MTAAGQTAKRGQVKTASSGGTDVFTAEKRSLVMSRIQGGLAKNHLERTVHNWLKGSHIKHEMNPKTEGWPDVRVDESGGPLYLFIDGCFWHMCPVHYSRPKSRQEFWIPHVEESNRRRELRRARLPYRWLRLWEHEIDDGSYRQLLSNTLTRDRRSAR